MHCLRVGAARLLDCTTAKTANGRVLERELLFAVTIFIRQFGICENWTASACVVFESRNMNAIDMLLL